MKAWDDGFRRTLLLTLIFALVAGLWLLGGDTVISGLFPNTTPPEWQEAWKEGLYLLVISLIFFLLLRREAAIAARHRQALIENRDHYRQFYAEAPVAYQSVDSKGNIREVNHQWECLTGYSRQEALGRPMRSLISERGLPAFDATYVRFLRGEDIGGTELLLCHRDGRELILKVEIRVRREFWHGEAEDICANTYCALFDVTAQRHFEEALRESESRLSLALENATDGIWDWHVATGETYFSPRWETMLGFEHGELPPNYRSWTDRVHPDDLPLAEAALEAHFAGRTPEYAIDHRLRTKGGRWKWILARGRVVERDAAGQPLRMVGTHVDIDRRKSMEQRLIASEARYHLVAQAGRVAAWELWPETGRLLGDPMLFRLLGYQPKDLSDAWAEWIKLALPESQRQIEEEIERLRRGDAQRVSLEMQVRHKSGRTVWLHCNGRLMDEGEDGIERVLGICVDISELRQAMADLQARETQFQELLDSLREGVWAAELDGSRILYVNRAVEEIYGRPAKAFDEQPELWLEAVHPQDRKGVEERTARLWDDGRVELEYRICHPDGEVHWVLDNKSVIMDAQGRPVRIGGVMTDITRRKQAEQALIREHLQAERYLEVAEVMLLGLDQQGHIKLLNRKGYEILGYEPGSLEGRDWFETVLPDGEVEPVRQIFDEIMQGRVDLHTYVENEIVTRSGERRLIAWRNATVRDDEERITGTFSSGSDITELHLAASERERLRRELAQAQKMEAVGRLTSGIAHDFNNILASVLGYTGLAIERFAGECPAKMRDYLYEVQTAGERARDLVAQLLRFSRGSGSEPQCLQLIPLVKEVVKMLQAPMTTGITFETDLDPDTPPVYIDPVQAHQALVNLCINARDAMGGRGMIHISLHRLKQVQAECASCHKILNGEWVELSVSDEGVGIEPGQLNHIFDPFFTTKELDEGSGMGLAVTRGVVEQHGGHILVNSVPGEGSCFRLLLPLAAEMALKNERLSSSPDTTVPERISGHLLVVDDEHSLIDYLQDLLQSQGCRVTAVDNAQKALECFMDAPESFDLVISDQIMPNMTGSELARRLLAIRPGLPVIIYSGNSESLDEKRAHEMGISRFLRKPVEPRTLLQVVAELLPATD
ncbi:PAS domain S-box protein [endosymbiont of Ridgeia piscesae]|uniref:histidine kinase n=1 Tax=endosymbiont of Ridgeia piscesae TaxID=54398 RepID=A0A0T5YXS3_9GAMM|nr:PAS domain S-box protein [endosymbiont of Ridgeia piscesae]KRT55456.1 PAS domain S-box [endosymbiont of Ridgeia piscesae]KRT56970.1 PAS domain S-box-containing protein [endosymbiont of Ridgeia piscesae]